MIDSIGSRIRSLRKFIKTTREDFSNEISPSTLRHWENGNYVPKENNIAEIIRVFKQYGVIVSGSWLKDGVGTPPSQHGKPIPQFSLSNENTEQIEHILIKNDGIMYSDLDILKEYYIEKNINHKIFMIIQNNMYPSFKIGEYVFGIKINYSDFKLIEMEPAILKFKNGTIDFCYFSFFKAKNVFCFEYSRSTANIKIEDIEDIFIVTIHRRMML